MGTPLMVCARDQWTSCSFCMHAHIKREIVRLDLFGSYSTEAKSAASVSSFAMNACHVDSTFIELPHVHLLKKVNCLNRSLNLIFFSLCSSSFFGKQLVRSIELAIFSCSRTVSGVFSLLFSLKFHLFAISPLL